MPSTISFPLAKSKNTTASKPCSALMYRIDGMGPVVTITARKDFTLAAKTVDIRTRVIMADAPVSVIKGTVLHFVESSLPNWYYICRVDAHGHVSCTCPARKPCRHMSDLEKRTKTNVPSTVAQVPQECPLSGMNMSPFAVLPELPVIEREEPLNNEPLEDEEFSEGEVAQRWVQEEVASVPLDRSAFVAMFDPCGVA